MERKVWERPQLIVLSRGRSDEKVLVGCEGAITIGPDIAQGGCYSVFGGLCEYFTCDNPAAS